MTGFMGAGKSTCGRLVAERAGCAFADADELIREQAGMPIPRIFATKGEVWFRRMEERAIRDTVATEPAGVLSVGGGAVESAKTRDLLGRVADVVYLKAGQDVLWERVHGTDRPLAADEAVFARRYRRREPLYDGLADLVVDATRPLDAVVDEVARWWADRG